MDVALELTDAGSIDIVLEGGDLRAERGLRSAALVSLLCDARAAAGEVAAGDDPRGWWGSDADDEWGSKLWRLAQAKRSKETLDLAERYAAQSLAWMTAQGITQRVDVVASYGPAGELGIDVLPVRGTARRWESLWNAEAGRQIDPTGTLLRVLPA